MIKTIIIVLAIIWALLVSFFTLSATIIGCRNVKEIQNLESWKILSEIKIPDDDGKGGAE